jgi:CheY-like chemotaxis protein
MIVGIEHSKPSSTVLLVEGDVLIRTFVAEYLRECGYRAMEAANVDEALAVLDAACLSPKNFARLTTSATSIVCQAVPLPSGSC